MKRLPAAIAAAAVLALLAAGCGGGGGDAIAEPDASLIRVALAQMKADCATGGSAGPGLQKLIVAARTYPNGTLDGRSMDQVLGDAANDLENCGATKAADQLDRVRETLE